MTNEKFYVLKYNFANDDLFLSQINTIEIAEAVYEKWFKLNYKKGVLIKLIEIIEPTKNKIIKDNMKEVKKDYDEWFKQQMKG